MGIKFKLCKYISEGTFGKLYSGINVKTNEEVAVKLVRHVDYINSYEGINQSRKSTAIV